MGEIWESLKSFSDFQSCPCREIDTCDLRTPTYFNIELFILSGSCLHRTSSGASVSNASDSGDSPSYTSRTLLTTKLGITFCNLAYLVKICNEKVWRAIYGRISHQKTKRETRMFQTSLTTPAKTSIPANIRREFSGTFSTRTTGSPGTEQESKSKKA
jgi:hypothetical protein